MSSSSSWLWSALPMAHEFEDTNLHLSMSLPPSTTAPPTVELPSSAQNQRKLRRPTFAAIHASFYHRRNTNPRPPTKLVIPTEPDITSMAIEIPSDPQAGILKPVHITTEETPWTVSVAENPHDTASFSVYIKTPTHHLTLTRTVKDITDLHKKLRESLAGTSLPSLPEFLASQIANGSDAVNGNGASLTNGKQSQAQVRGKSSFFSRFGKDPKAVSAQPQTQLQPQASQSSSSSSPTLETNVSNPSTSSSDTAFSGSPEGAPPSKSSGLVALSAYLATLANNGTVKGSRAWKRFVHVRTDDLQSSSRAVERTRSVKRVRSDLGHAGRSGSGGSASISSMVGIGNTSVGLMPPVIPVIPNYSPITPLDADALLSGVGFEGGASDDAAVLGEKNDHATSEFASVPSSATNPTDQSTSALLSEDPAIQTPDHTGAAASNPSSTQILNDELDEEAPATPVMSRAQSIALAPPTNQPDPASPVSLNSAASHDPTQGHAAQFPAGRMDVERAETPVQHPSGLVESSSHVTNGTANTSTSVSRPDIFGQSISSASTLSTSPELEPKSVSQTAASDVPESPMTNGLKRSASAAGVARQADRQNLRQKHHQEFEFDTDAEAGFDTDIEHPDGVGETATETEGEGDGDDTEDTTGGIRNGAISDADALVSRHRHRRPKTKKTKKSKSSASSRKVTITDFEMMRVLGKGCAGKVLLVRHKASDSLYALKAITKRHVLAHQELQHTLTEQAVLKRMARESQDPFVVKLWWSFHDKENLFLVMDFHPGGDLATQLARWGRLGRDRARFYAAEIVEGVEGLHAAGVVYRDLKPENILIGADGHIVLTDFGLSKEFPHPASHSLRNGSTAPTTPSGGQGLPRWMSNESLDTWKNNGHGVGGSKDYTNTFCGTAEYLAPEVIQGLPYSYEVDWWSFGTMLYEMLSGITPFWANNHSDMYVRVLQDELQFPEDKAMDQDTKSLIRGLLQRNPALRMREPRVKKHPYFSMIDWSHVYYKRYIPPYIPPIDPLNASDTQNFDEAFLDMDPTLDDTKEPIDESEHTEDEATDDPSSSPETPAASATAFGNVKDLKSPRSSKDDGLDVFDGYSFKGRQSIIIDDDDEFDHDDDDRDGESDIHIATIVDHVIHVGSDIDGEAADEASDMMLEDRADTTPDNVSAISIKAPQPEVAIETPRHVEEPPRPASKPPSVVDVEISPPTEPSSAVVLDKGLSDLFSTSEMFLALQTPLPPSPLELKADMPVPTEVAEAPVPSIPSTPAVQETPLPEVPAPVIKAPAKPPAKASSKHVTIAPPAKSASRHPRRGKSGIPALDGPTAPAEDIKSEEDDWDFVEKDGGEEENVGPNKQGSLFSRGVVDRYKLAVVFRKSSGTTPQRSSRSRFASGQSSRQEPLPTPTPSSPTPPPASLANASPTPSETKRRGRTPGLNLRKSTREFLRAKSPNPFSPSTPKKSLLSTPSNSGSRVSSTSLKAPATRSLSGDSATPVLPSLRTKASDLSHVSANAVASPSSSHPSLTADEGSPQGPSLTGSAIDIVGSGMASKDATLRGAPPTPSKGNEEGEKSKNFNKKMKVGAEKVMSLFTPNSQKRDAPSTSNPAPPSNSL